MTRRLALLVIGVLITACGSPPVVSSRVATASPSSTGPPASGRAPSRPAELAALVGTAGAMRLVRVGPDGRLEAADPGVPPDAAWLSSDGSTLVVTTLDGRLVVGQPVPSVGRVVWASAPGDPGRAHPTRAFGTIEAGAASAAGGEDSTNRSRRVALVEGDPGSGGSGHLVVVPFAGGPGQSWPLPMPAESAPAWLSDGRLAVVVRDRSDRASTRLVDPATGQGGPGPALRLRSVAIARGLVAAIGVDGTLRVGSIAAWLAGTLLVLPLDLGPDEAILEAQPSPGDDEVALVVADPAGDAASIRLLALTTAAPGGWHEIARFSLPSGANRAVVSWLVAR